MRKYPSSRKYTPTSVKEFLNLQLTELLPNQDIMIKHHLNLVKYLESETPLFILRKFSKQNKRGNLYTFKNHQFTVSDNEPALWVFMESYYKTQLDFKDLIENKRFPIAFIIPEEEKQGNVWKTKGRKHIEFSANGWKHCHIFPCSPKGEPIANVNEIKRRSLRLLSPLNHFPFFSPRKYSMPFDYGEKKECIEFVIWWLYNNFYIDTNKSYFKSFVEEQGYIIPIEEPKDIKIEYSIKNEKKEVTEISKTKKSSEILNNKIQPTKKTQVMGANIFKYNSTRFSFRKATIDSMNNNDVLIIKVMGAQNPDNNGKFKMTKTEIYETFNNVITSKAYQDGGNYNYKTTPKKADKYKVN